ncbi:HAD family hydrolase [Williamsia sp. R60]
MNAFSAIVFDWGGVLTDPPLAGLVAYNTALGLPDGALSAYVRGDGEFAKVERGELGVRDFLKGVCVRVRNTYNVDVDIRALASAMTASRELQPSMIELLGKLAHSYDLAVLSNNVSENKAHLDATLPGKLFTFVLNSADVGLRKPDPDIYKELLRRLDRDAAQVIYVDDFEENLPPAAALGITTILYRDTESLRQSLAQLGVDVPLP